MECLFFVASLDRCGADASISLTDDRDEKVEQQDDVEKAADPENKPVAFSVELQVVIKLSESDEERALPRLEVVLEVLFV